MHNYILVTTQNQGMQENSILRHGFEYLKFTYTKKKTPKITFVIKRFYMTDVIIFACITWPKDSIL